MNETTSPSNLSLSASDERFIKHQGNRTLRTDKNVNLNGNENSASKHNNKRGLTEHKHNVISQLNHCNHRTPPKEIALLLSDLLYHPDTIPTHWLYVAQNWPPRAINRTIEELIKLHQEGWATIDNPARYFTFLIQKRKKRKSRQPLIVLVDDK